MKYRLPSLLFLAQATTALAAEVPTQDEKGFWYAQTSVYTRHFAPDKDHNNNQDLIGLSAMKRQAWCMAGRRFATRSASVRTTPMPANAMTCPITRCT